MEVFRNTLKNKPSVIFLMILFIVLVLLLLASLLIRSGVFGDAGGLIGVAPTAPVEEPTAEATETEEPEDSTPTPTVVVLTTATPSKTPTLEAATPTRTATKKPSPTSSSSPTPTPTPAQVESKTVNVLRNGGFEWGVGDDGVALRWNSFDNGGAKYIFSAESWPLAIRDGKFAQRITIFEAHQPDRYAGIYQRLNVLPGAPYWLTLHGQIRSRAGDIAVSQYGYRMQYAVDWGGGTDWGAIPAEEWVELPWDEQLFDSAEVQFIAYSANLVPPNSRMTLFIRAWNKWADPVEAQYTLDTLSLIGPASDEVMIDQPLPTSGGGGDAAFATDPRFWASLFFLILLAGSVIWRNRYTGRG